MTLTQKVIACAERGMSQKEIAAELGVQCSQISRIAKKRGLELVKHKRPPTASHERYRAAAEEGLTVSETAKRFGVARASVYSVARAHGITFKSAYHHAPRKIPQLGPLLSKMESKHLAWLVAETPKGAALADTIRAIITDAYLDDMDRIPAAQPRSEAPEARKAFPRMTSAASMKRPCAGENMGSMR